MLSYLMNYTIKNEVNHLRLKPKAWGSRVRGVKWSAKKQADKKAKESQRLESLAPWLLGAVQTIKLTSSPKGEGFSPIPRAGQ